MKQFSFAITWHESSAKYIAPVHILIISITAWTGTRSSRQLPITWFQQAIFYYLLQSHEWNLRLPWQGRSSVACVNWLSAGLTVQCSTSSSQWMSAVIWLTGTLKMTVHELLQWGLDDYIQHPWHPCHHHHHRRRSNWVLCMNRTNKKTDKKNQTDKSTNWSKNTDLIRQRWLDGISNVYCKSCTNAHVSKCKCKIW